MAKQKYSKEELAAFQENRTAWNLMPDTGQAGTKSGSGTGGSGAIDSYAIAAQSNDPNAYIPAYDDGVNPALPDWYRPPDPAVADPSLAAPLPKGMSLQTLQPGSPELAARQARAQASLDTPEKFVDENVAELNRDQTLIDKGLDFMGRLFNYEDESDLQIFGLNLSAVESTWDMANRYLTGGRNLLDIGIGGLVSAMPGGLRTLSYDELSGNTSVMDVLHGDIGMQDNVAPTPMQIAMTSVAIESKRIREGGARLSDVLLSSPAIAPFLLAGIAADTSPLQKEGFNIMDPEQRKAAFSQGYEQFFSGLGDFGVQMADPLIAAGAGAKILQTGLLGTRKGRITAQAMETVLNDSADRVMAANAAPGAVADTMLLRTEQAAGSSAQRLSRILARREVNKAPAERYNVAIAPEKADDFWNDMHDQGLLGMEPDQAREAYRRGRMIDEMTPDEKRAGLTAEQRKDLSYSRDMDATFDSWHNTKVTDMAQAAGEVPPRRWDKVTPVTKSSDELGLTNPMDRLMNDILQVDESTGKKVMTAEQITQRKEFRRNPYKGAISSLLHDIDDPYILTLTLQNLHGSNQAAKLLSDLRPALADDMFHMWSNIARDRSMMDPSKVASAKATLEQSRKALVDQRAIIDDEARKARIVAQTSGGQDLYNHNVIATPQTLQRRANIEQSIEEIDGLLEHMDGKPIDRASPGPFYDPDVAFRIKGDLYRHADNVEQALQGELKAAMRNIDSDARLITGDNWYARTVAKSRERSARARYEYLQEGTGLIPRKVLRSMSEVDAEGNMLKKPSVTHKWEWGWKAGSEFGTGRIRRAGRVWRWASQGTPSGYVGIKGGSIMGAEDELSAALDLDLYKGAPVEVTKWDRSTGAAAAPVMVGGAERRAQLLSDFLKALSDPAADPKSAIVRIERAIESDFADAYGVPAETMGTYMRKADKYRSQTLDQVKTHGMFVDPDTREVHHVPYLKQQLANGHYMHNWHHLENTLQRYVLNEYGPAAGGAKRRFANAGATTVDVAQMVDAAFQSVWRPAVLFRMSYTQRNVFEGMTRAMGYYASVAPMAWPVVATYHGLDNVVRKKIISKVSNNFVEKVAATPVFKDRQVELVAAMQQHNELSAATPPWLPTDVEWKQMLGKEVPEGTPMPIEPMRWVYRRDETGPKATSMTAGEWQKAMEQSYERVAVARRGMEDVESVLDDMAGNGRFGKWRKKNVNGLRDELCEAKKSVNILSDLIQAAPAAVTPASYIDEYVRMAGSVTKIQNDLDTLRFDPTGAISMWKDQAGRERRIGSGTSLGPGGGTYSDAFADEFEAINRGQLSSDTARKMSLSSANDVYTSIFRSQFVTEHQPIPWDPANRTAWVEGMSRVIETNSWNPLIKVLVDNDMSVDAGVEWMLRTPEGTEFAQFQRWLEGTDFETPTATKFEDVEGAKGLSVYQRRAYQTVKKKVGENYWETVDTRLRKSADRMRDPVTGQYEMIDHLDAVTTYVTHAATALMSQMQEAPQFLALQARRAASAAEGSSRMVTTADIENALETLSPEQMGKLGAVMGSQTIESGTKGLREIYRATVDKMFKVIGTIPEDAVVRGPFYAKRFKQVRNDLIENYLSQQPGGLNGVKRGRISKGGKTFEDDLTHPKFQIPEAELQDILRTSHRQALFDTREYLYTIERRTKLGKYGEYIWPFISAQQNTLTAGGKILYKNPWIAPLMYDLYSAPQSLGWRDEDGNLQMPMPLEWVKGLLEDASDIPVIGGVLSGTDMVTVPMNGLNVWAPDTGFGGVIPRPGALVQWSASELMRVGLFPVDTPEAFVTWFGKEQGAEYYGMLKDYMFGEEGAQSTRTASYDVLLPPWMRRILDSRDEMSDSYAYNYQLEWAAQGARAIQGERDWPTADEINKRVTNKMWFYAFGNFGVPTPLTPYPILTRPDVQKPMVQELQNILQMYQSAQGKRNADGSYAIEPGEALTAFARDFGEDLLPLAMSGTTVNVGGADPTEASIADIKAYDHLIRDVAPGLGNDLGMLDMLVNNSDGPSIDYSQEAYRYEKTTKIPGISEEWRQTMTGAESTVKRNVDSGWADFARFTDQQESKMHAQGIDNPSLAAARPFNDAKAVWLINMSKSNPDWYAEYNDGAVNRTQRAVGLLSKMVADSVVQKRMMGKGQESLYGAMQEYVYYRQQTAQALEQAAGDDVMKDLIKQSWATIRLQLKQGDVRWSEIATRWLSNDDSPQFEGEPLAAPPMAMAG